MPSGKDQLIHGIESASSTESHMNAKDYLCNLSLSKGLRRLIPIKSNMCCWIQSGIKGEYRCNCCHLELPQGSSFLAYSCMNVSGVQMCFGILHKKFVSEIRCDTVNSVRGNYYDRLKKNLNP